MGQRLIVKPIFHCDAKPFTLGPRVGLDPQHHIFVLGIPTCWYLKTLKFALPPTRNIKFALAQTQNPNMSQWNIGCVSYCLCQLGFRKESVAICVGCPTRTTFLVEYGLNYLVEYGLNYLVEYGLNYLVEYGLNYLVEYGLNYLVKYGLNYLVEYGLNYLVEYGLNYLVEYGLNYLVEYGLNYQPPHGFLASCLSKSSFIYNNNISS